MNLAATIGLWLLAATPAGSTTAAIPELAYEKYCLPNGLEVILHEDHSAPIVGVNIWYHVGSKNERPGRTGFAHLFEHMMFEGSQHHDADFFAPLQEAGGRLNGSTAEDRTNYWETVPSNYLELALWLEADRMGFLLPAMSQKKLDNQRSVVKNERRQSYENRPYGVAGEVILAAMYPPDHPYSWPVIGSMADLTGASREDIAAFFRRYYHPANASLCIAGDFRPEEAKRWVAKYFGPIPAGPKVDKLKPWVPELKEAKRIRMVDRVGLARVYLVWHTPGRFATEDPALEILGDVLGGGRTSRLYRSLVREKQIAQDVAAYQDSGEIAGQFQITATARPGHTPAELEAAIDAELRRALAEPPTAEEIGRAVHRREAHLVRSLESISGFGGRADRLNMYNVLAGDPGYWRKEFQRLVAVDAAAVLAAAREYLRPQRVVLEVTPGAELSITPDPRIAAAAAREAMARNSPLPLGEGQGVRAVGNGKSLDNSPHPGPLPKGEGDHAGAAPAAKGEGDVDRRIMPKPGPAPSLAVPTVQRRKLASGIDLLVVEKHELPEVNLHFLFRSGRLADPATKLGLAELMGATWDEGTRSRTSIEIADQLAGLGADLSIATGLETTSVGLFSLKSQLPRALEIYGDVLRNPAFPKAEVERQRNMALGRLVQIRKEPLLLASLAAGQVLFGPEHPYGRPHFGTAATLKSITPEDLAEFYRGHIRPEQATVIAVGDVTADEIARHVERLLADWHPAGQPAAMPSLPEPPAAQGAEMVLVDRPGAAQSVLWAGVIGAQRHSPDYFPLTVMNTIFGGQFMSRLNQNLREEKGYTYGARSSQDWRVRQPGPYHAGASVQTAVTAPAVAETLKEWEGMLGRRPITPKELEFAKAYLVRGYGGDFETPRQVLGQLEMLVEYGLPDDYFRTVVPSTSAVTGEDVLRVARKYLDPGKIRVIVVGDRKAIEAELRKLPQGGKLVVRHFDDDFRLVP